MPTVQQPPKRIVQEADGWCFAAAEAMICAYYVGMQRRTQAVIAEEQAALLADAQGTPWAELDDVERRRRIIETEGVFNERVTGGVRGALPLTARRIRTELMQGRIFVIGSNDHYYVVYGHEGEGQFLIVHDPLAMGAVDRLELATVNSWQADGSVVFFPNAQVPEYA